MNRFRTGFADDGKDELSDDDGLKAVLPAALMMNENYILMIDDDGFLISK